MNLGKKLDINLSRDLKNIGELETLMTKVSKNHENS